jgi:hypothetical protein
MKREDVSLTLEIKKPSLLLLNERGGNALYCNPEGALQLEGDTDTVQVLPANSTTGMGIATQRHDLAYDDWDGMGRL